MILCKTDNYIIVIVFIVVDNFYHQQKFQNLEIIQKFE